MPVESQKDGQHQATPESGKTTEDNVASFENALERFLSRNNPTWMTDIHYPMQLIMSAMGDGSETVVFMEISVPVALLTDWLLNDRNGFLSLTNIDQCQADWNEYHHSIFAEQWIESIKQRTTLLAFLATHKGLRTIDKKLSTLGYWDSNDPVA